MSTSRIFTVDKFLGLNESEDGSTELKLGEATAIKNFNITDGGNLKVRPGVALLNRSEGETILGIWRGLLGTWKAFAVVSKHQAGCQCNVEAENYGSTITNTFMLPFDTSRPIKLIPFGDRLFIFGCPTSGKIEDSVVSARIIFTDTAYAIEAESEKPYIPVAVSGMSPEGAGTTVEPMNILSKNIRLQYSSDGEAKQYVLPGNVVSVESVVVDNSVISDGSYDAISKKYTFTTAPEKGVNNVEFLCAISDGEMTEAAYKFYDMRFYEAYNGATDTRLFFYGDGSNVCYYTGVPAFGSGFYLPAGNEIAIDANTSAITAMCRDYSRLIAFKADCAFSITYEPTTLADGSVIAGFTVRPVHKELGCDVPGQVQIVGNYPRTICRNAIYDWKIASYSYRDERYAKAVSERVKRTLRSADLRNAVACDNTEERSYYLFLNDDAGTVLVHRYELDVWTMYQGEVFKGIRFANTDANGMLFATDERVYYFNPESRYDVSASTDVEPEPVQIEAEWESGYMSFGAPFRRKYSSTIWLSLLPERASNIDITVSTDMRDEYRQKNTGLNIFGWDSVDFSDFSFMMNTAPKIKRIKLKVKKFVYYKMVFRVSKPGATATVLSYDQHIRYSSFAK